MFVQNNGFAFYLLDVTATDHGYVHVMVMTIGWIVLLFALYYHGHRS